MGKAISTELSELIVKILAFRDARDWAQFHSFKNLAAALSVEAAELLELTQWKTDLQLESELNDEPMRSEVAGEVADILIYLLLICEKFSLDPIEEAFRKIGRNELRYPVEKSRGNAKKQS